MSCERCRDLGIFVGLDGEQRFPCSCIPDESRWRDVGIPLKYHDAPLSKLSSDEIVCSRIAWGPQGRGKTTQAVGVLKRFARARFGGRFVDLPVLEDLRRRSVGSNEPMPGDDLHDMPFLVLDDVCRNVRLTAFWEEYISGLIRTRYNHGTTKTTVFTSNFPVAGKAPSIASIMGDSISGRILEMCGPRVHDFSQRKNWRAAK